MVLMETIDDALVYNACIGEFGIQLWIVSHDLVYIAIEVVQLKGKRL